MIDDYVNLTDPEEVIRKPDQVAYKWHPWMPVSDQEIGTKVSDYPRYSYKFRRPRATAIRDAAIAMIDALEKDYREGDYMAVLAAKAKLEVALGKRDELRGHK